MNRVAAAIEITRTKLGALDGDAYAKAEAGMAVDFNEHFEFQQMQSRAHVMGLLSTDEAQIVYAALGEVGSDSNGGWSAGTDLATKYAVTVLMGELARKMVAARGIRVDG